jgi:hypothetical protein
MNILFNSKYIFSLHFFPFGARGNFADGFLCCAVFLYTRISTPPFDYLLLWKALQNVTFSVLIQYYSRPAEKLLFYYKN